MDYILAFAIYAATCTPSQIRNFECELKSIDYTDIITKTAYQCRKKALSPITKQIINLNYSRVWVVPFCETYTREVSMKIKHYVSGI